MSGKTRPPQFFYFLDTQGNHRMEQVGLGQTLANNPTFDECEVGIYAEAQDNALGGVVNSKENYMDMVETGYRFQCVTGNLNGTINRNEIHCISDYGHFPGTLSSAIWIEDNNQNASAYTVDDNNVVVNQPTSLFGFGVFVRGSSANPTVNYFRITNNDDIVVETGTSSVYALHYSGVLVQGNTLIAEQATAAGLRGAALIGGADNTIFSNDIQGPIADGLFANRFGIISDACQDAIIRENTIFQFENGVTFDNPCGTDVVLRCNHFQGTQSWGLYYSTTAETGPQIDEGNTWEGTYLQWGAENDNTNNYMSDFYSARNNPILAPGEWPPSINPGDWFTTSNVNPMCPVPDGPNLNSSDSTIAEGGMTGQDGTIWSLERYLYDKLKNNPSFLSGNGLMQGFVNARQNAPMGQLYDMGSDITALYEIPNATKVTLDETAAEILSNIAEIQDIDSLLATSPPDGQADTLLDERNTYSDAIATLHTDNAAIYASLHNSRVAAADSLLIENSGITTSEVCEANEKQFFDIYLRTIAKDNSNATTAQLQTLKSIAVQCPEEGGRAVYWAIGLYGNFTDTLLEVQDCEMGFRSENTSIKKTSQREGKFSIFPNPSSGECHAIYRIASDQAAQIIAYDLTGVKVSEYPLIGDVGNITLSKLPTGIYFLHLIVQGGTEQVEKFIKF